MSPAVAWKGILRAAKAYAKQAHWVDDCAGPGGTLDDSDLARLAHLEADLFAAAREWEKSRQAPRPGVSP